MAFCQMSHTWSDGSTLTTVVSDKARYPDAIADLAAITKRLFADGVAEVTAPGEPSDDTADMPALEVGDEA